MKTRPFPSPEHTGEFLSEVCLPVRVRYRVGPDGGAEMTQVALESTAILEHPAPLLWARLPLAERCALEAEIALEVARLAESRLVES